MMAMKSTIWKTMEYPMPTTSFSSKIWNSIISVILLEGLPKVGANRNFPRAMVFANEEHQGLGFKHPFWLQVIKHLQIFTTYFEENSPTGNIMQSVWESVVQVSGYRGPMYGWPWKYINSYIPTSWLSTLLEQAGQLDLKINIPMADSEP